MRDPAAHIGCRAWIDCPRCGDIGECAGCRAGANCDRHWRYLLGFDGRNAFLQCPECRYRWWADTGFGVADRPPGFGDLSGFRDDVA